MNRTHIIQTAATHVSELHRITKAVCTDDIIQIHLIIIFAPPSLKTEFTILISDFVSSKLCHKSSH